MSSGTLNSTNSTNSLVPSHPPGWRKVGGGRRVQFHWCYVRVGGEGRCRFTGVMDKITVVVHSAGLVTSKSNVLQLLHISSSAVLKCEYREIGNVNAKASNF